MSVGRKILIGLGSIMGLAALGTSVSTPMATAPNPASAPVVLSARTENTAAPTLTPTASPTMSASPKVSPTPSLAASAAAKTPIPTPATVQTYTNVDGNQVESPDGNAEGATGICRDGSYTHAVHHKGACSSHGGVARWL